MAEDLDDGEFWLPSQFLADDDLLVQQNNFVDTSHGRRIENEAGAGFPFEFPYGFGSNGFSSALSSPVESPGGSTETESDEEDYMAGLARQMAYSMLQDDEKVVPPSLSAENTKSWVLAGSPQSTLCAVGSWSVPNKGSNRGIPSRPSRVASPPSIPVTGEEVAWDLLCEAAGQVVRFRMNEEPNHHQGRGLLGPPRKPYPISVPLTNPSVGFYSNKASISHQQLQASQFQQLKHQQQELLKQQCSAVWGGPAKVAGNAHVHQQQVPSNTRGVGLGNGRCVRPLGLSSSAWPPLQRQQQQAAGSGMRAVFLGGSSSRRESCGTGVFLPRRIGNPSESRKKPACSTVLVPARVMQALNLDLDDLGTQPRLSGGFASEHDLMMARRNLVLCQQKQHQHQQRNLGAPQASHEIGLLPQEWTY